MKTVYTAFSFLLFAAGSALAAQPVVPPAGVNAAPAAPVHGIDCDRGAGPCAAPPPPPAPPAPPPPPQQAMKAHRLAHRAQPPAPPAPPRPPAAPMPPAPPDGPQPR